MQDQRTSEEQSPPGGAETFLSRALLLDLEVTRAGRILEVGAALAEETLLWRSGDARGDGFEAMADLAGRAACVVGHNLRRHDLPRLREVRPMHPVLALPVVDTLELSPLAFPRNPYHRLVKDHKLVRESVNDPVSDARLAGQLLRDEHRAFEALRGSDPDLFQLLHALLADAEGSEEGGAAGYAAFFGLFGAAKPARADIPERVRRWVGARGCSRATLDSRLLENCGQRFDLAYALAWLSVAGTDSVSPPWVRHAHPGTGVLLRAWREVPCGGDDCAYCRVTHDPREQLRQWFRFDDFRPLPANAEGGSLQRDIVAAGMRNESLLAVLPTGGGKSLCFQVPAIARNFRRGVLTVVLSPLQALMKDQVDGLVRRTGLPFAAALHGLQTPPERGAVLRGLAAGDMAIVYVAPEQLRNQSFETALSQREIGCWVFDEAHCLSKWGHDFRPDYLYAGRFIREFAQRQGVEIPPIACFTATAKREVRDEILEHFRVETGRELRCFEGGVERDNLDFEVEPISTYAKLGRLHERLSEELDRGGAGSAVVFRSRRDATEVTAAFLLGQGWKAAHFHAGLTPPEKKRIQDEFLSGAVQVICATNAFGMGIDKDDVRLVIHADTPGSLENYLQEAGRAGRDGRQAACVLLYDEADCEDQFRLGAHSELSSRDLAGILRAVRRADRGGRGEVVMTTGEILRDEEMEANLVLNDRSADTQVRTAIAWLERAGFLQRDENVTSVFQARLLVRNLAEAEARLAPLNLSEIERGLWLAILREIMAMVPGQNLTVDRIALLPEFERLSQAGPGNRRSPESVSARILKILRSMDQASLLRRDLRLNAFVRHKVADHSRLRLERLVRTERSLLSMLAEADPEPEGWVPLALRPLNQRLLDEGCESSVELVRSLLRSLSEDGKGFAGSHGSLELRFIARDAYRVRVVRSWRTIEELAGRRQQVASLILEVLAARIPADQAPRADVLVEFGFDEISTALDRHSGLRAEVRDVEAAIERALMYLHEQSVIVLQQGLAIFRSAMTLRLSPERGRDRYRASDFEPLRHHYRERTLQVHVMAEYARRGLQRIQDAQALVSAYFALRRKEFLHRYFRTQPQLLEHATTADSFRRIVTDLGNPAQIRIVTAPVEGNLLVLAGPGSGKTRTVVHRCAYLLRVERVPARSVLVCCFNRHAALEVRRRLVDLVGDDARGVLVQTYHGLALRLLGRSLATPGGAAPEVADLDRVILDAVALLEGRELPPGMESDEVRDRLLSGFRHILVDEYQDIDEPQYAMISAIAGRKVSDTDQRLSIMAVGDDDQNIYAFRGANVRFIGKFREDYDAEVHYLVENHRSTRYLIEAANQLIGLNADRMKSEYPIRIDQGRLLLPAGGEFAQLDPVGRGRVRILRVAGGREQALTVIDEVRSLGTLGVSDLSKVAVLAETHRDLAQVRALMEVEKIPVRWLATRTSLPMSRVREIRAVLDWLTQRSRESLTASRIQAAVEAMYPDSGQQVWVAYVRRQMEAWRIETNDAEVPAALAREFLLEACAEARHGDGLEHGIALGTVHAAKGTEYDHVVLIGAWVLSGDRQRQEESRRAFYVGMTRARSTLTILHPDQGRPACPDPLEGPAVVREPGRSWDGRFVVPSVRYEEVGLDELDLGFAGRHPAGDPVHAALARLQPGSRLTLLMGEPRRGELADEQGHCVVRFSKQGAARWASRAEFIREIRVLAVLCRSASMDPDEERRRAYRVEAWEVPVLEIVVDDEAAVRTRTH